MILPLKENQNKVVLLNFSAASNCILKENILFHTNITEEWIKTPKLMTILCTAKYKEWLG
jgi:hypothetical protein